MGIFDAFSHGIQRVTSIYDPENIYKINAFNSEN
jgi:hypothetical protein